MSTSLNTGEFLNHSGPQFSKLVSEDLKTCCLGLVPSTHIRWFTTPVTQVPRSLLLLCSHSAHMFTHIHTQENLKLSKY